jgi:hypothetical protein
MLIRNWYAAEYQDGSSQNRKDVIDKADKNGTLQQNRVPFLRKAIRYYGLGMKTKGVAPDWKA